MHRLSKSPSIPLSKGGRRLSVGPSNLARLSGAKRGKTGDGIAPFRHNAKGGMGLCHPGGLFIIAGGKDGGFAGKDVAPGQHVFSDLPPLLLFQAVESLDKSLFISQAG